MSKRLIKIANQNEKCKKLKVHKAYTSLIRCAKANIQEALCSFPKRWPETGSFYFLLMQILVVHQKCSFHLIKCNWTSQTASNRIVLYILALSGTLGLNTSNYGLDTMGFCCVDSHNHWRILCKSIASQQVHFQDLLSHFKKLQQLCGLID